MSALNEIFDLLGDSDGELWTNLGRKMDIYRGKIISGSPFDKSVFRKIYQYGSRLPVTNLLLNILNKTLFTKYSDPVNADIVGPPHIDGSRSQTLLAGDRESIITEVYDGSYWHEIALTTSTLHIFPGKYLSKEIGIKPTYHRYSMKRGFSIDRTENSPNVTLLLGLVDANNFRALSKHFE